MQFELSANRIAEEVLKDAAAIMSQLPGPACEDMFRQCIQWRSEEGGGVSDLDAFLRWLVGRAASCCCWSSSNTDGTFTRSLVEHCVLVCGLFPSCRHKQNLATWFSSEKEFPPREQYLRLLSLLENEEHLAGESDSDDEEGGGVPNLHLLQPVHRHLPHVESVCSLCQQEVTEEEAVFVTPCEHYFHVACRPQDYWWTRNRTCPNCRTELAVDGEGKFLQIKTTV